MRDPQNPLKDTKMSTFMSTFFHVIYPKVYPKLTRLSAIKQVISVFLIQNYSILKKQQAKQKLTGV